MVSEYYVEGGDHFLFETSVWRKSGVSWKRQLSYCLIWLNVLAGIIRMTLPLHRLAGLLIFIR